MKPSELIPERERERIEAAVRAAEAGTSGEIVVSVVGRSSAHAAAPWRMSVALAALALLGSPLLPIEGSLLQLFGLQGVAVVLAHLLCRLDFVRRAFITEAEFQRKAELAALRAFAEHGIRRTEARTGILIYITLFEHRVVVLGDEAVDQALGPDESWQEVVELVLTGIREGRASDGIANAVRRCGEILSHPLPVSSDDRNEIEHGLILSD